MALLKITRHRGKALKQKRLRVPKTTVHCYRAVTRELFEGRHPWMGKIEWRKEMDEYNGKTNSSEEEAGLSPRSMEVCLQGNEQEVPLKEKACEIRRELGCIAIPTSSHEGLRVSAKSLQKCPTLHNPIDCSLPDSPDHGILQARIPEWVATSSSRGSSWPRDQTHVSYISCIGRRVLYHWHHLGNPPWRVGDT